MDKHNHDGFNPCCEAWDGITPPYLPRPPLKRDLLRRAAMHPLCAAADEGGGVLIGIPLNRHKLEAELATCAPGCGSPTHVAGTNGGTMPCGGILSFRGKTGRYFCGTCSRHHESHHD